MTLYNFFTRDFNLRTKLQRKESPKASKERNNFPGSLPQELLIIPHYWQGWVHQLFIHCLPSNPQLALRSAHHPLMLCSALLPKEKKMVKNSGLEPHRGAFFGFLSLSLWEKEKSQHISTGTAVALIWEIFCKTLPFRVCVGCKLLMFWVFEKNYFKQDKRCYHVLFGGVRA